MSIILNNCVNIIDMDIEDLDDVSTLPTTNTHKITRKGFENLKAELQKCEAELPAILKRIVLSKEYGDLSENGEYKEAKESMNHVKILIDELTVAISTSIPIDTLSHKDYVDFGAEVSIEITNNGNVINKTYVIVGELEGDIDNNRLSINTLLSQAMLNKRVGAAFDFNNKKYKIISIVYDDKNVIDPGYES